LRPRPAQAALTDDRDPWTVYREYLIRVVHGGSQALAQRLAGTFTPTPDLGELARRHYVNLVLQALHAPGAGPIPGPAASPSDLAARWRDRRA